MKDLLFFICFILIFLCGFSIASWSLLSTKSQITWFYNEQGYLINVTTNYIGNNSLSWQTAKNVMNYGIWKIFGQIDPIDGTDSYSSIAFILAIIFVAIANVLLLNVLVALFNITIQNVQEQAHDLWRYQRFLIVNEYSIKTPLPPPFNIIYYLFIILRYVVRLFRNRHNMIIDKDMIFNSAKQQWKITDAMQRESAIADDFWRYTFKHTKKDRMDIILENLERKIDHIKNLHLNRRLSDDSDI